MSEDEEGPRGPWSRKVSANYQYVVTNLSHLHHVVRCLRDDDVLSSDDVHYVRHAESDDTQPACNRRLLELVIEKGELCVCV